MKTRQFQFILIFLILVAFQFCYDLSFSQQITWSKIYGDTGIVSEQGVDILQTFDGNYVVLAARSYDGNNQKILLLKLDMYGNVMWEKMVADSILSHNPYRFQQTHDSGFIITGVSGSAFLIKTDKNGNLKWRKVYTDTYPQTYSSSVITTPDRGFVFCGRVPFFNPPSDRGYIVKTDSVGSVEWERIYEDSLFTAYGQIIFSNDSNSLCISGGTYNITQPLTYYTIVKKVNLTGDMIWRNIIGRNSGALNIMVLDDTSLIISSIKQSPFTPRIFRIDTSGSVIWDQSFMSPSFSGGISSICKDNQNNIQRVGGINGNITYTEISSSGQQLILRPFQSMGLLASYGNLIKNCKDSGFMIVGTVFTGIQSNQRVDILVIKTDSNVNAPQIVKIVNSNSFSTSDYALFQNYPNPFNSQTSIRFRIPKREFVSLKVYDVLGKEFIILIDEQLEKGEYSINFNGQNLSSGLYFYKLTTNNYSQTKKLSLIK